MRLIGKGKYIFYGGARGGGKSHLALAAAVYVCVKYPGIKVVLVRRARIELKENFAIKMQELYPETVFKYQYKDQEFVAVFQNGSRITFRPCETEKDTKRIKGLEYQFMVIDEANELDDKVITKLRGSLRNANPKIQAKGYLPTLLMTGNPGGVSDPYFKHHFIHPNYNYWNPRELKYKDKFVFIPAFVQDNPTLMADEEYYNNLDSLDDTMRRAWLLGDWNVFEGQFFTEWNEEKHVVQYFDVPESWERVAGLDQGGSDEHPTVCLWAARNPVTLDVVIYREYTGKTEATELSARKIVALQSGQEAGAVWSDPSIWTKGVDAIESPATIYMKNGLAVIKADNNRINGWRIVKQWLHWRDGKEPRLKIMNTCENLIRTIPTLKYDKHANKTLDLDTKQSDDYVDALRYLLVSGFDYPTHEMSEASIVEYQAMKNSEVTPEMKRETAFTTDYEYIRKMEDMIINENRTGRKSYQAPTGRSMYV